jgi:cytochrome c oxidase subunit 1
MWNGRLRLTTPMLFCIGFVSNFIIGGVTGVFLASIPVDLILHDTYYVVGHFHYIVMGAIGFAAFAGIYYWFPIFTGRMYQRTLGKAHFWFSMVGTNITFFAMLALGYLGMPRRYATYQFDGAIAPLTQVSTFHQAATVGAFILFIGQLFFVWNIVQSWLEGPKVEDGDPWDLESDGMLDREFQWFDEQLEAEAPEKDPSLLADGGQEEQDDS